jgi:hypothetical protein
LRASKRCRCASRLLQSFCRFWRFGFVTRRRLLQVAGRGLWFGFWCWRCGSGRDEPMAWVRFVLARLGLGQEQGSYRKCGHFFFCGGGGEGEGDETSCCDYSRRCCMLGFALGVLSGERRAVNQIIVVKDHVKCSWPWLDHWMQAQATASTTALIDELSLQLCCSLECPSCSA